MLIRWATESDLPAWYALATEVSSIFRHPGDMGTDPDFTTYAKSKASKYEARSVYRENIVEKAWAVVC